MKQHDILERRPKVLSQADRTAYFERGYVVIDRFIGASWLRRLWEATHSFIEESKAWTASDHKFDLEPDHCAERPRLRRLSYPTAHHPVYWEFASQSPIVDIAEDLLGPNVVFHHSKLNFKWSGGGEEVKWHQDYPFYPHTSYSVLAIGLYLSDVDEAMGPMGAIPGSQRGPVYSHYGANAQWAGALSDADAASLPVEETGWMLGKAGTVTVHNCVTVHGSRPNHSERMRPLLINAYAAADAAPLTVFPQTACEHNGTVVRGQRVTDVAFEAAGAKLPPDWSRGYSSIFALQQEAVTS